VQDSVYEKSQRSTQSKVHGAGSPLKMLSRFLLALRPTAEAAFAAPAAASARTPQVLRLRDAVTDQEIRLIGCIHEHPMSSLLVKEEIARGLKQHKQLGAVVVEADSYFWQMMLDKDDTNFDNEMHTAAALALQNNFSIMLGDQEVNRTMSRLKQVATQTAGEFIDPIGGWRSIFSKISNGWSSMFNNNDIAESELLLDGEAPLSLSDYMKPEMVSGFWTNIKFKPPFILFAVALCVVSVSLDPLFDVVVDSTDAINADAPLVLSLAWDVLLVLPFLWIFRIVQDALLDERNAAFAKSIRRAAAERNGPVVATFGAAHINGVARLLLSKEEPEFAGPDPGVWWEAPKDLNITSWR